ncbi:hypothetical protein RJT34_32951 [Clitoria ternatea]|uniref:Uncharacterized protein n=1 Tax=Clitoria ternatea TaxID=43366 RepID=A0AAN9EXD5_CLITE
MASRGRVPLEGMRHGAFPGLSSAASHHSLESRPHPQLLEDKIASQEAEIERLVGDNRRLASTHVALRESLVAAAQDVQKLKSHIRSIQTESDIQIRVLLDKIAKGEVDIRASDSLKKDLKQAHIEAQNLATSRQELSTQIHRATQELKKVLGDVKSIPDLQAELDSLVQEHKRLRATFEYEKNKNIELVDYMKAKEKNLIAMAREVEMLRAEILNAEKRVNAPNLFRASTPVDSSGPFVDAYGKAHGQTAVGQVGESMVPIGESNGVAPVSSAGVGGVGSSAVASADNWAYLEARDPPIIIYYLLRFPFVSFVDRVVLMAEIELKTAPADFRFPTTNQTKHCFTRYIEFHRCLTAKGENAGECEKFAKYYRSLCPGEWVERWNEQRDNGTFPGPL